MRGWRLSVAGGSLTVTQQRHQEALGAAVLPTIVLSPRWALQVSTDLLALPPDLKLKSPKQTLFS